MAIKKAHKNYKNELKKEDVLYKYDDMSWHYNTEYPDELPEHSAATHIGMFTAWCAEKGFLNRGTESSSCPAEDERIRQRELTGAEYLIEMLNGRLLRTDLTDEGKAFADDYYSGAGEFANSYAEFLADWSQLVNEAGKKRGQNYKTCYHFEDSWDNYSLASELIEKRYRQWLNFNKKSR